MHGRLSRSLVALGAFAGAAFLVVSTLPASAGPAAAAKPASTHRTTTTAGATTTTAASTTTVASTTTTTTVSGGGGSATFSTGQMQDATVGASGCGTNAAGEPAIHVRKTNGATDTVILGSENGLGGGSELWRGVGQDGGPGASACALEYRGQPNAVSGAGASGGDIDIAIGSAPTSSGFDPIYVASLNLGSVSVSTSTDNGTTFSNLPVQGGLPGDDREWIAAYGANTSLLTFHDISTSEIDVLRSDNTGTGYAEISQAIPQTAPQATNNELGNIVIDHNNTAGTSPGPLGQTGFWAYQSLVGPASSLTSSIYNEAFVSTSNNGGFSWTLHPIPCSETASSAVNGLDHNFPNVSVAPNGNVWMSWSDDTNVFTAVSADHGSTWSCSGPVSTNTSHAIFPWMVATSSGVDLVYYGATGSGSSQTWSVYFAQDTASTTAGWGTPQQVVTVHSGSVCESGATCTGGRQLFDDFGVDTDSLGLAHIAYSHDAPSLGGSGTYTGYAVQTGGTAVGVPN